MNSDDGATAAEYAVMLAAVFLALIVGATLFGDGVELWWTRNKNEIDAIRLAAIHGGFPEVGVSQCGPKTHPWAMCFENLRLNQVRHRNIGPWSSNHVRKALRMSLFHLACGGRRILTLTHSFGAKESGTVAAVSRSGFSGGSSMVVENRSAETFTKFDDADRISDFATGITINIPAILLRLGIIISAENLVANVIPSADADNGHCVFMAPACRCDMGFWLVTTELR